MKTIKAQRLGLLHRTFENGNECFFAVTIFVFFRLDDGGILPEVAMWKLVAEELGRDVALDEAMPKQRGEVLVTGRAFPSGGAPAVATTVRVRMGAIDKSLRVVGDREWRRSAMTQPAPFTEMPLTWARAFGGEGFASNPLGRGFAPAETPQGVVHQLPNIEDPSAPVRTIDDTPMPAGFGGYDFTWPQRFAKVGNYDNEWLKTRFPGFAGDMDWSIFNVTAADQQIEGYFRGDEEFLLENMHPTKPTLRGRLPGLVARCFINRRTADGEVLSELSTRLDTVHLFPHAERGILVYRAIARVTEDDADDVLQIMIACERHGEPRPVEHYHDVLRRRLDREVSHLYALRDDELLPPPPSGAPAPRPEKTEMDDLIATEGLLQANLRRRYDAERAKMRAAMAENGFEAPEPEPPPIDFDTPPPTLEQLPAFLAKLDADVERQVQEAQDARAKAEAEAEEFQKRFGIEPPTEEQKQGGPPRFSAQQELANLREMYALAEAHGAADQFSPHPDDPAVVQQLTEAETKLKDVYRRFAHHMPDAGRRWGASSQSERDAVAEAFAAGRSLVGTDLTGVDLSDMDLRGADLRGAMMECCCLENARLDGADLSDAVLARADLTGATLTGANLTGANLGAAKLHRVVIDGANLTEVVFAKADLTGATGRRVVLTGADLTETILSNVELPELQAPELILLRVDLSGLKLAGANLAKCTFLEGPVTGTDFSGADLTSALFLGVRADGATFRGARLENLRLVQGSSLRDCDLADTNLDGANLRGACLAGADLSRSTLNSADLSGCDLSGARLHRIVAREVRMVRADLTDAVLIGANLMMSVLQKARIDRADFTGANLFRADLAKVRGRPKSVVDALLTQARVVTRGNQ